MRLHGSTSVDVRAAMKAGDITVTVVGLGKMGLPLVAAFGEPGARIIGVDIDENVVASVNAGRCHVVGEAGLPEAIAALHKTGRLEATRDLPAAVARSNVVVIIVPILLTAHKTADMTILKTVCEGIGRGLRPGTLVIQESTVPPGTTVGLIRSTLERSSSLVAGRDFGLAFCPERTLSGRALADIRGAYPKVIGALDKASAAAARGIYESINSKGVLEVSSPTAAEAVKVFEGVYRDVNIALANELAIFCEGAQLDAREVIDAANTQPYSHIHKPGPGVGGHCIPVYPYFLTEVASTPMRIVPLSRDINDRMAAHTVQLLDRRLREDDKEIKGSRIAVLGLTYRPGVKETRFSPAFPIIAELTARGAIVSVYDPLVEPSPPTPRASLEDLVDLNWAALVVTLDDASYRGFAWDKIAAHSPGAIVVDTRRGLDATKLTTLGLSVISIGNGTRDRNQGA